MRQIILTDEQKAQLDGLTAVEVFDQAGQPVGFLLTPEEYEQMVYAWAKEEFAREEREHPYTDSDEGSMTTAEVLEYLESLDRQESGAA